MIFFLRFAKEARLTCKVVFGQKVTHLSSFCHLAVVNNVVSSEETIRDLAWFRLRLNFQ